MNGVKLPSASAAYRASSHSVTLAVPEMALRYGDTVSAVALARQRRALTHGAQRAVSGALNIIAKL